jgi:hypothetical protein
MLSNCLLDRLERAANGLGRQSACFRGSTFVDTNHNTSNLGSACYLWRRF